MKKTRKPFLPLLLSGLVLLGGCGAKDANEIVLEGNQNPVIEAAAPAEAEAAEEATEQKNETESEPEEEKEPDTQPEPEPEPEPQPVSVDEEAVQKAAEEKLYAMSTGEKVWQLFIVSPEQLTGADVVTRAGDTTKQALIDRMVGGLCYSEQNLYDIKQAKALLGATMGFALKENDLPLFFELPEALSESITAGIVKAEYGYGPLVISEALNAPSVTETYLPQEAAVLALQAGNDMLLLPADMAGAHAGIMQALSDGTLSEDRLNDSVRRILTQKYRWMQAQMNGLPSREKGDYFYYIDARKQWHFAYYDPDIPRTLYDPEKITNIEEGVFYEDPAVMLARGIDVSSHNGTIDYQAVREAGFEFVIIRAAFRGYGEEGTLNTDSKLHENLAAAQAAGLMTGVYVFSQAINEEEAVEEAELVLKELGGMALPLPVVFDPESIEDDEARTDDVSGEQFTKNSIAFCERIRSAGYEPMIYSNMIWEAEMLDLTRLASYRLWYADYENKPQTPYRYSFWQYSEEGSVPGVDGPVDLDVWFRN